MNPQDLSFMFEILEYKNKDYKKLDEYMDLFRHSKTIDKKDTWQAHILLRLQSSRHWDNQLSLLIKKIILQEQRDVARQQPHS